MSAPQATWPTIAIMLGTLVVMFAAAKFAGM